MCIIYYFYETGPINDQDGLQEAYIHEANLLSVITTDRSTTIGTNYNVERLRRIVGNIKQKYVSGIAGEPHLFFIPNPERGRTETGFVFELLNSKGSLIVSPMEIPQLGSFFKKDDINIAE